MKIAKSALWMICAVSVLATPSITNSYVVDGRKNCPWYNLEHTWANYLSLKYGDRDAAFSIHFSRHIGDIEGGTCYTAGYQGNQSWVAWGKVRNTKRDKTEYRTGGDPAQNKVNVWGAMFTFNEAGELTYDADGQPAGQMYCHLGSECWK
ncbi:hypothetical protein [Rhizobium sp. CNPSo 3490]|uniref:hypothetical protein n=1 Tax=Rhizobium sp. CNPSo 3490 TaxID=3021407 RepID=UPI00254B0139|nr:hypothetical protein [Rhizobium sp. CNPSo 3490]MDK4731522.1 hypothetical protein [Rhizobium sp. CNPSo 3490]